MKRVSKSKNLSPILLLFRLKSRIISSGLNASRVWASIRMGWHAKTHMKGLFVPQRLVLSCVGNAPGVTWKASASVGMCLLECMRACFVWFVAWSVGGGVPGTAQVFDMNCMLRFIFLFLVFV